MNTLISILTKIAFSLLTEALFKELAANSLEIIVDKTETDIDNKLLEPVIKALRK